MLFEETELWEILLPGNKGSINTWYSVILNQVPGVTFPITPTNDHTPNQEEYMLVTLACNGETFKKVLEKTADHYSIKSIIGHRVSNVCLIGYEE